MNRLKIPIHALFELIHKLIQFWIDPRLNFKNTGWSFREPPFHPTHHSDTSIPTILYLHIVPLPGPSIFKSWHSMAWPPEDLFKYESMGAIPKHSIMQNTFSPTSKVPIVYRGLNSVKSPKFKVSSETHDNLLTLTPWKPKSESKSHISNIQWHRT